MPVRGSANYVWFTDKSLGSGSTGMVYLGRHKRSGDVCAIKVFANGETQGPTKMRELEVTSQLKHDNIVRFLAIEEETHSKDNVLIMELCSEGSVHELICRPENNYGFPETLFVTFFKDLMNGLEYLRSKAIIHRDIKPGNILCSKLEDGRLVFKLTDFGAARQLNNGDQFTSMYGTEEYLHPDVYEAALLGNTKRQNGAGPVQLFDSSTDIWSIGATIYHAATGQLPFQPWNGRANKDAMYKVTTQRPPGAIFGIQKENNGDVSYGEHFPDACLLSRYMREFVESLIAECFERNAQRRLTYERLFQLSHQLKARKVYHVLSLETCELFRIYLSGNATYEDLQRELFRQTGTSPVEQMLFFNERLLSDDVMSSKDTIEHRLQTSEDNPVAFLVRPNSARSPVEFTKVIPNTPRTYQLQSEGDINLVSDASWSHDVCAFVMRLRTISSIYVQSTRLLQSCHRTLSEHLFNEFRHCTEQFDDVTYHLKCIDTRLRFTAGVSLDAATTLSTTVTVGKDSALGSSLVDVTHKEYARVQKLKHHIEEQIPKINFDSSLNSTFSMQCDCEKRLAVMTTYVERSRKTCEQFRRDKKSTLTYNDTQIHKYDTLKQEETRKKALALFDKCFPCTQKVINVFQQWLRVDYNKVNAAVSHVHGDLQLFRSKTRKLATQIIQIDTGRPDDYLTSLHRDPLSSKIEHLDRRKELEMRVIDMTKSSTDQQKVARHSNRLLLDIIAIQDDTMQLTNQLKQMLLDTEQSFLRALTETSS